jgi:hypothetical protein
MPDPRVAILITAKDLASKAFDKVGQAGSSAGKLIATNWKTIAVTGLQKDAIRALAVATADYTRPLEDTLKLFSVAQQQGARTQKELKDFAVFWDTVGDATGESSVELGKMSIALRSVGIGLGQEKKALGALGFVLKKTSLKQKEFMQFIQKTGPELRELGLDVNQSAAIMGLLGDKFGATGREARQQFTEAVIESDGTLQDFLSTIDITADELKEYTDKVKDSSDVIQDMADIHADSYTVMQKVHHWISELVLANGELIQKATDLAPLLIGVAMALTAIVKITPLVRAAQLFIAKGFTKIAVTSRAAALGISAVKASLGLLAAFMIGWKIGTILADKFVVVQKAGIAMAGGLMKAWNWIKGAAGFAADFVSWVWAKSLNFIKDALVVLLDSAAIAADHLYALGIAGEDMATVLRGTSGEIQRSKTAVKSLGESWDEAAGKIRAANAAVDEIGAEMFVQADLRKKTTDTIEDETEAIEENTEAAEENTEAKRRGTEAEKKRKKEAKKKEEKIELPMRLEQIEKIPNTLEVVRNSLISASEGNIMFGETMAEAVNLSTEKLDEIAVITEEKMKFIDRLWKRAAEGIYTSQQDMWNAIFTGQEEAHKALLKGMANTLAALIDMAVAEILIEKLVEIGKALIEAPGTFGASMLKIPLIVAAAAAATAGLRAIQFAEGGIVRQATLGLVGEAGPEAIIPLDKFGGFGATYNIQLVGPFLATPVEAREWAQQLTRYIDEENAR